jgi:hypothetical protein
MWGNAQGWIFSGVIAVLMGAMFAYVVIPPGMTAPTGTLTMAMKAADLGTDPDTIVNAPSGDADAGVIYESAAKHWTAQKDKFEPLKQDILVADKNIPEPITEIISAVNCKPMTLFSNHLDEVINYRSGHPTLESLNSAGELLNSLALLHTTDKYLDANVATRYATAAFNLGRHLYTERIVFIEWMDGLTLMESASRVLAKVETDPGRQQTLKDFAGSVNDYVTKQTIPLWKIIGGISEDDNGKYPGDMFQIARESPERMWRVEATLKLGKLKFLVGVPTGDHNGAKRFLTQMAASQILSPDPLTQQSVHAAALAAADLTIEDFRLIN